MLWAPNEGGGIPARSDGSWAPKSAWTHWKPDRGGSQRVLVVVGRWWVVVCGVVRARRSFAVAVVVAPPISPAVRVPKVFVVVRGGARSGDRSGRSPEGRRGDKSGRE